MTDRSGAPEGRIGGEEVQHRAKTGGTGAFALQTYLYLIGSIACATVLLSGLLFHFQQQLLRKNIEEAGNTIASFLTENLRLGIFAENAEEIRRAVLPVLHDSHVEAVAVFDRGSRLLQSARRSRSEEAGGDLWSPVPPAALFEDPGKTGDGTVSREEKTRIVFWRPVRVGSAPAAVDGVYFLDSTATGAPTGVLGYVAVAVSKEELRAGVRAIVETSAGVGVVFLLLGSLVAYLVVRTASRPLHRLVEDIRQRGIPTRGGDDLGILSDTFSDLIDTLERSFSTIDELRLGLERKVEERTGELLRSNGELQAEIRERARVQEELKEARDDLERRVVERTAELETTHRQLLHSEKLSALGTLTASVAHELSNPLSSIRGILELTQRSSTTSEDDSRLIDVAIQECDRISRLINGLRSFYQPSSHAFAWMDVNETIEVVLLLCGKESLVRGIQIEASYGEGIPRIPAVVDQIKQVLLNLIKNALDATDKGGVVRIRTELDADRVKVEIEDTGSGITEAGMARLFEPFFSTKTASGGTGLGLSISRKIIESHRGEIDVVSEVGHGTLFTISLPTRGPSDLEVIEAGAR